MFLYLTNIVTLNITIANHRRVVVSIWIATLPLIPGTVEPAARHSPLSPPTMQIQVRPRMWPRALAIPSLRLGHLFHPNLSGRRRCWRDLFDVIIVLAFGLGNVLQIRGMLTLWGNNPCRLLTFTENTRLVIGSSSNATNRIAPEKKGLGLSMTLPVTKNVCTTKNPSVDLR